MNDPAAFISALVETFDKGGVELFRAWMAERPNTTKWMIAADFALRDRSRPGDCFAFTIIPYEMTYENYKKTSEAALPRDLKDSRNLEVEGVGWLRNPTAFHIIFPINADRAFFFDEGKTELEVARASLGAMAWKFQEMERDEKVVKRARQAVQKSRANGFNVALLTDLTILSLLLPFITLLIARDRKPEVLGWFCDRDSMITWGDGLIWDMALENLHGLAERFEIDTGDFTPMIAEPDRSEGQEVMWFDHFVRTADWLAGALAAWNWSKNEVPDHHPKYRQLIEEVCADAANMIILPVRMTSEGVSVSRLIVGKPAASDSMDSPVEREASA